MQDTIIKTPGKAFADALIASLPDDNGLNILIIGTISRPTGEVTTFVGESGPEEIPVMEPVDGYWLIVRAEAGALPESWSPFITDDPGYLPGGFSPYAEPTPSPEKLAQAKEAKLSEINATCQRTLKSLTPTYPERELTTFDKQESEARAYLADATASTPLLSALAAARGIELADLVGRVIAKADAFAAASGHIIGQRQALEDQLDAAETLEDVQAITATISLPGAA